MAGAAVGLTGFGLVVYSAGWLAGLGVFLAVFGHNLEKRHDA